MNKKIVQNFIYQEPDEEIRLDFFIAEKMNITRSQAQKLIKEFAVFVNGEAGKPKNILRAGDGIEIIEEQKTLRRINIPIIYEDNEILVINKPAGISVHPAPGETEQTVTELFRDKLNKFKDQTRPGVVHRLDKGTSGVMVLAKTEEAQKVLQAEFKKRSVQKTYLALIHGQISPEEGIIQMPISRDEAVREKLAVTRAGKEAITEFKTINKFNHFSLLSVMPKTGRTHQIRVHLSALGHPIVGDVRYGMKNDKIDRIFLHAKRLKFKHPKTKQTIEFETDLPEYLSNFLKNLD